MRPVIGYVRGHLRPLPRGVLDGVRDQGPHRTTGPDGQRDRGQGRARGRDRGRCFYVDVDVDVLGGRIVVRGPVDAGTAGVVGHCIAYLAQTGAASITVDLTHAELVLVVAVRDIELASSRARRSGSSVVLVADGGSLAHRFLATWAALGAP